MSEDSSSEKEDDVVARAEAELRSQPLDEPDWDAMAERVLSALPRAGAIEATLLEAPLSTQADEMALERASSMRAKGAEPSVQFGSEATLDDAWADLPASETTSEEPAFTAVASMPYVATETAVTESGIVETAAARNGRSERAGERELVSLDELIPERGRERSEILPPSREVATELTAKSGEHGTKEAEPESPREAVSLADLARSSVSRRAQEASSIAKESIAVARTHTGVARRVQGTDAAANLPSVMIAPSAVDPPTEPPVRAPSNQGPIIGAAIAIVGLAAGFAFYIAGQGSTNPLVVTQVAPAPALDQAAAPAKPGPTAPVAPVAKAEPSPASPTPPAATEVATAPAPAVGAAARPTGAGAPPPSSGVAPEKVVLNEEEPGVRAEKVVLDEDPGTPPASKAPPSGDSPPLKPAELSHGSGGMPDRPSSGAVQAAVGSVLGAARSCLAGQLEPSNARVLFVSDGSVQSVQISGPAAGTPAASCIESAFKKARVQPFAAPSFSFGTKVRPP